MSKKILLADDSVTIQKVVELTFMDEGVTVVAVGNGSDALARFQEVDPDLVIADIHMPGASGYEVSRRVKELRPSMPVLLLVGTFEPFSKEEFASSGADASMKKPFDAQELLREVMGMLSRGGGSASAEEPADDEAAAWQLEEDEPTVAEPVSAAAAAPSFFAPSPAPSPAPPVTAPAPDSPPTPAAAASGGPLSDADVDRIARRVVELLGDRIVREVSWEVIPDLAEVVIKDRLRELESQVE